MTFLEAIKSGRRFRRNNMTGNRWYYAEGDYLFYVQEPCGDMVASEGLANICTVNDLLATDWEVEDEEVTFKRSKLEQAISNAFYKCETVNAANLKEQFLEEINK